MDSENFPVFVESDSSTSVTKRYELDLKIGGDEFQFRQFNFSHGTLSKATVDNSCWVSIPSYPSAGRVGRGSLHVNFRLPNAIDGKILTMKEFDVDFFASKPSTTTNENEQENKKTSSSYKSLKLVRVPELCRKGIKFSCMKERLPTDHKFFYRSCSFYSACDYWLKYRNRLDTIRIALYIEEAQDVVVKSKVIHPPLTGVESSLGQFFGSKALSDVTLVCVEDGKEFPAHRLVLSMASPVFCKMFQTKMTETQNGRVEIKDLDSASLEFILKWIYSGKVDLPEFCDNLDAEDKKEQDDQENKENNPTDEKNFEYLINAYKVAHKYFIDPLKEWIAFKIASNYMNTENVLDVFEMGDIYGDKILLNKAKELIIQEKKVILWDKQVFIEFVNQYPDFIMQEML